MRVVITGGAGFIGRAVVARLAARGDQVVALVRDPASATHLQRGGVELVASDLSDAAALTAAMAGADAVIHGAGMYRVGMHDSEKPLMWDANVGATERALDAAIAAKVPRIVYVSTANAFGNTRGAVPDETYRRNLSEGFVSYYDETKFRAHEAAERRIAAGAPIILIQPTQVYGPHDYSAAGGQLRRAYMGRLRFTAFGSLGMAWVHVDDVADGIVAALGRGRLGEAYILAGAPRRLGESVEAAARLGGHRPPRLVFPTALFRLIAAFNDRVVRLPGLPPNAREIISASDGVTYWANAGKAIRELGFGARSLEQGIADTWGSPAGPARSA